MLDTKFGVVLVKPRFPENIGMVVRACANFGCQEICLVDPEKKDLLNAIPLATPKGMKLLKNIKYAHSLAQAVCNSNLVIGTTARTGGWRRGIQSPEQVAKIINSRSDQKIALVFGPEDRGLLNSEIILCDYLVNINTSQEAPSLNLAQAVLILLYEFSKINNINSKSAPDNNLVSNYTIKSEEKELMLQSLKQVLLELNCIHGNNPDYDMQQWRDIFTRANLKKHEYDTIMGLCRQIHNKIKI